MPRVKIDYIVSFSSEDPGHPANNLLSWEITTKKWLCTKGEPSCSIVMQLTKAVEISRVDIGTYNVAILEVFVALSEKPDSYEVLVPSCVVLTPSESRGAGGERVRSVPRAALAPAATRRWDRVRVVCSQRYNKHCQYGLSFVHLFSPESPAVAAPERDSDEEVFRPGELFAAWRLAQTQQISNLSSTEAQIRQATSRALKNVDDSTTKLVKTAIITKKGSNERNEKNPERSPANRGRASLIYTEDEQMRDKNDQVEKRNPNKRSSLSVEKAGSNIKDKTISSDKKIGNVVKNTYDSCEPDKSNSLKRTSTSVSQSRTSHKNKTDEHKNEASVLAGCSVALSGYVAPRRGELRALALRLGAAYHPRLCAATTHLVCAFPNTPKLREMRALRSRCVAVADTWLEACRARRRRVPWRKHAAEPALRDPAPDTDTDPDPDSGPDPDPHVDLDSDKNCHGNAECPSECDTEDEIERVLHSNKRKRTTSTGCDGKKDEVTRNPGNGGGGAAGGASDAEAGAETDVEASPGPRRPARASLPDSYDGLTFVFDRHLAERGYDIALLDRYIRAYGGIVLERSRCEEADYVVGGRGPRALPARWVWRARRHDRRHDHDHS